MRVWVVLQQERLVGHERQGTVGRTLTTTLFAKKESAESFAQAMRDKEAEKPAGIEVHVRDQFINP